MEWGSAASHIISYTDGLISLIEGLPYKIASMDTQSHPIFLEENR